MDEYMEILSEPDVWNKSAPCVTCDGECPTPFGYVADMNTDASTKKRTLRLHVGGSICTDVSIMGFSDGLEMLYGMVFG